MYCSNEKLIIQGLIKKREYVIELNSFKINHVYFEYRSIGEHGEYITNIEKNTKFKRITVAPIVEGI